MEGMVYVFDMEVSAASRSSMGTGDSVYDQGRRFGFPER